MIDDGCSGRSTRCRRNRFAVFGVTMSFTVFLYICGIVTISNVGSDPLVDAGRYRNVQTLDTDIDHVKSLSNKRKTVALQNQQDDTKTGNWDLDEGKSDIKNTRDRLIEFEIRNKTKRLPQAIIIGVKKAGTRALLEYLRLHPDVRAPGPEPHFFDKNYEKGLKWYRNLMPETYKGQITIEKTPSYFVTKGIPQRVYKMSKKTKLIVVFRDPATRAISDYAQLASRNPSVKSFEEMVFINNETKVIDTSWTIVKIGLYALHLSRWLEYFPINQIHFVSGENLINNPANEIKLIQEFLGLQQHITAENFTFNHTKGFPCYKRDTGKSWHCLNDEKGRRHPNIASSVRERLQDFYRPFNHRLYSMAGKDFNWS